MTPDPAQKVYSDTITDSRRWQTFRPRAGDVIVTTPPKSGTTWTQAILALLASGDPGVDANPSVNAPWFDNRFGDLDAVTGRLAAQTGLRHVKSHTPLDGIPHWPGLRYIAVYRHPVDVHFSFRRHVANMQPGIREMMGMDMTLYPEDPRESFRIFLEHDGFDAVSLDMVLTHYESALARAGQETLLLLHYADMTRDRSAAMAAVAAHVGVSHPPEVMAQLAEAAGFGNMKANADRFVVAAGGDVWQNEAGFFDSATSNKWEGVLTADDMAAYDRVMAARLEAPARHWLEWGGVSPGSRG